MTEHSFGCLSDQEAMGLHDLSKAQVYQKPKEITEEELFCKLFPEYVVNGKPLSPYFDLFEIGYEQAENRIAELKKTYRKQRNKRIDDLQKENAELKARVEKQNTDILTLKGLTERQREQLTKAKELLAKWVELFKPKGGNMPPTPIQVKTEQFLSEVEK